MNPPLKECMTLPQKERVASVAATIAYSNNLKAILELCKGNIA